MKLGRDEITSVVIGTAGHVDHGKTRLVEALTGINTDRWEEERDRGITIDIGFASRELPDGRRVGFIDVPGHERFVRHMIAGAAGEKKAAEYSTSLKIWSKPVSSVRSQS